MLTHIGEISAIAVAFCWTISAIAFEVTAKKLSTITVNIYRLIFSFIFLSIFTYYVRGFLLPTDAQMHQWIWLSISGIVGFTFGDFFLFKAFRNIGSRLTMVIMTLAPIIAAIFGYFLLDEQLTWIKILAIFITIGGVITAISARVGDEQGSHIKKSGLIFAFLGMIGQSGGLVLSKYGMRDYDPFASTQIRLIAGLAGYLILSIYFYRIGIRFQRVKEAKLLYLLLIGAFFGSFLGVSLSLLSVKHTSTGVSSALISIVPLLLIIPSIYILKQKIKLIEIIGAVISVMGIVLFFV